VYKDAKRRESEGCLQTVTMKGDAVGDLWLCFSVCQDGGVPEVTSGKRAGFYSGLRTLLAISYGTVMASPRSQLRSLKELAAIQRLLSHKQGGSRTWWEARWKAARVQRGMANRCYFGFFKLARNKTDRNDILMCERSNLKVFAES
jgi:transposase